jgi:hypothetical protein
VINPSDNREQSKLTAIYECSNCYQAQLAAAILESMVDVHPEVGMRGKLCMYIYTYM